MSLNQEKKRLKHLLKNIAINSTMYTMSNIGIVGGVKHSPRLT